MSSSALMCRAHGFLERKLAEARGQGGVQGIPGEQRQLPLAQAEAGAGPAEARKRVIGWGTFLKRSERCKKKARAGLGKGGEQPASNGSEDPEERLWKRYAAEHPGDAEALGLDVEVSRRRTLSSRPLLHGQLGWEGVQDAHHLNLLGCVVSWSAGITKQWFGGFYCRVWGRRWRRLGT